MVPAHVLNASIILMWFKIGQNNELKYIRFYLCLKIISEVNVDINYFVKQLKGVTRVIFSKFLSGPVFVNNFTIAYCSKVTD